MPEKLRTVRTAVVTGPTGAIGTALIRRLAREGVQVWAVVRPDSARAAAIPEGPAVHRVALDISELERLPELVPAGADAFYHLAWTGTTGAGRNDMPAQIGNVRHTIAAVRAAAALGCRVFVGAGSQAEYGRSDRALTPETPCFPENGYGMAKLCAGQMSRAECARLGLDHIWTRVLSVYGPGDGPNSMVSGVIRRLLAGEKPALTAGEQMWDYLYCDDAAAAFALLGEYGVSGCTYVVGSGTSRPLREYIGVIRDSIDPALPLGFGEVPYSPLQVMHLEADISRLRADTGFEPETDFQTGVRAAIQWIKDGQK